VGLSGPSDFIRCESRQTGPVGACSWLCECTQPVRCRSLNAAARSHPHRRHRQRPSRLSIRTLSGVSRWPLPHWHFAGGNLAATVSARERNDSRAISRDQAPATTELPTSGHRRYGGAALLVGVVQQVNNPVSVELRRERGLCHAGGRGFESRRSATTCGVSLLAAHSETIQVKDRA